MKRYIKSAITNPEDETLDVRHHMASDPNTRPEILAKLADDTDIGMVRDIVNNPNTTADTLMYILLHSPWVHLPDIQRTIIDHPNASAEILELFSCSTDKRILNYVGQNEKTPLSVLNKLANSNREAAREGVAKNPNTPADILRQLSDDDSIAVLFSVGRNPNTPQEILAEMLFRDDCDGIQDAVLRNPNTPTEAIKKFIHTYSGTSTIFLYFLNMAKKVLKNRGESIE